MLDITRSIKKMFDITKQRYNVKTTIKYTLN